MDEQQSARAYTLVFFGRTLFKWGVGALMLVLVGMGPGWRWLQLVAFGGAVGFFVGAVLARVEAGTYGYGYPRKTGDA